MLPRIIQSETITLLLLLTLNVLENVNSVHVKIPHAPKSRIIGGYPVSPEVVKYMVHVKGFFNCGGILLTEKHVLTSAQCVSDRPKKVELKFGAHKVVDTEEFEVIKYASSYATHPDFNPDTYTHDLAIIELSDPININKTKYIDVAKLPNQDTSDQNYVHKIAEAYGWGWISQDPNETPSELMAADLYVLSFESCKKETNTLPFHKHEICTSGIGELDAVGICDGDLGGPLVFNNEVIGVASRTTTPFCSHYNPSIFVSVGQHLDWIEQQINEKKQ